MSCKIINRGKGYIWVAKLSIGAKGIYELQNYQLGQRVYMICKIINPGKGYIWFAKLSIWAKGIYDLQNCQSRQRVPYELFLMEMCSLVVKLYIHSLASVGFFRLLLSGMKLIVKSWTWPWRWKVRDLVRLLTDNPCYWYMCNIWLYI
jgi:hypothetical protein